MRLLKGIAGLLVLVLVSLAVIGLVAVIVFAKAIRWLHIFGVHDFLGMDVTRAWNASAIAAVIFLSGTGLLHFIDRRSRRS